MQWYDFALYGAFATIIGPVFFPAEDPSTVLLAAFAVYATALIVRPGWRAAFRPDGRSSRATGCFRSDHGADGRSHGSRWISAGLRDHWCARPITLLGLRATQGLAAGGELGVAGVLIFERAPSRQRGRFSSWHTATLALGLGVGMVVAAVLLAAQRSDPLEIGWWRLAFVLALPLGLVARLVRRRVNETSQFLAVQGVWSNDHSTDPDTVGQRPCCRA